MERATFDVETMKLLLEAHLREAAAASIEDDTGAAAATKGEEEGKKDKEVRKFRFNTKY